MERKQLYQFITQNFRKAKLRIRNAENGDLSLILHGKDKSQENAPCQKGFRVSHKEKGAKEWSEFLFYTFVKQTPILFTSYFPQPTIEEGHKVILGNDSAIFEIEADVPLKQLLGSDFVTVIEQDKQSAIKNLYETFTIFNLSIISTKPYYSCFDICDKKAIYGYLHYCDCHGNIIIPESEKALIYQLLKEFMTRVNIENYIYKQNDSKQIHQFAEYILETDSPVIHTWITEIMMRISHDKVRKNL